MEFFLLTVIEGSVEFICRYYRLPNRDWQSPVTSAIACRLTEGRRYNS